MIGKIVVLDSGALDRAVNDRSLRVTLRELVADGWAPVIPTVTLAETINGRPGDASVNHLVRRLGTTVTPEATARHAGRLRHRAGRADPRRLPSAIDAIVAAHVSDAEAGVVFTTDPKDLRRLLADDPNVSVEPV